MAKALSLEILLQAKDQAQATIDAVNAALKRSKTASDQASEAATRLELAQINATKAAERAALITQQEGTQSLLAAEAQAKAALAAQKVVFAEDKVSSALEKAQTASKGATEAQTHQDEIMRRVSLAADLQSSTLGRLAGVMDRGHSILGMFGEATSKVTSGIGGFFSKIGSGISSVTHFAGSLSMAYMGLQQFVGTIVQYGGALIKSDADMEQYQTAFKNLIGSTDLARAHLSNLYNFTAHTPFQFQDLVKVDQTLISMGFNAKQTIPMMTSIGNRVSALGGSASDMEAIATVLGKIKMGSKLTAVEMMELTKHGVPSWQYLADAMHLTVSQVQDLSKKGLIPADKAINALLDGMNKMGNGMDDQSKTFNGLLTTVKDNAMTALRVFTGPIFDKAKEGLVILGNLVASDKFQQFATMMGNKIAHAFDDLGKFLSPVEHDLEQIGNVMMSPGFQFMAHVVGDQILGAFKDLGTNLMTIIHPILARIAVLMADPRFQRFIATVAILLRDIFNDVGKILGAVIVPVFMLLLNVLSSPGFQAFVVNWLLNLHRELQFIGALLNTVVVPIFNTLGNVVLWVANGFADAGVKGDIFRSVAVGIGTAIAAIKMAQLVEGIASFLVQLPIVLTGMAAWATEAWSTAIAMIILEWPIYLIIAGIILLGALIFLLIVHWKDVISWLTVNWGRFSGWFMKTVGDIGHWFQQKWGEISGWFSGWWGRLWGWLTSTIGGIGAWFSGWGARLSGIFGAIGAWIGTTWNRFISWLYDQTIGRFMKFASGIWKAISPIVMYVIQVFAEIGLIINALLGIAWGYIVQGFFFIVGVIWNFLLIIWGLMVTGWTNAVNAVWVALQFMWGIISKAFAFIWNIISPYVMIVVKFLQEKWAAISAGASAAWNWISTTVSNIVTNIVNTVKQKFDAFVKILGDRWTDIKNGAMNAWNFISNWFNGWWPGFSKTVVDKVVQFRDNFLRPFNDLKNLLGNAIKYAMNAMIDSFNNGIAGIEGFANWFGSGLNTIADNLHQPKLIQPLHLGRVQHFAKGTSPGGHPGGPMLVGEKGPELLVAPAGTAVLNNQKTMAFLKAMKEHNAIPGYAGGVGDVGAALKSIGDNMWNWVASGAETIVSNVISTLNIQAPVLPGKMANIAGAIFDKVKGWAVSAVDKIMPKFDFGGGGNQGGGTFGSPVNVPGSLMSWIAAAMALTGVPGSWAGPLATIAMHESGGNPNAINNWDSNAAAGIPSQGLFQTIPPTFAAYSLPGHKNILNPIDNAIAGIRYIESRYGSVFNVPGIVSMSRGGPYVGYANGGIISEHIQGIGLRTGTKYQFGERGKEAVVPLSGKGGLGGTTYNLTIYLNVDANGQDQNQLAQTILRKLSDEFDKRFSGAANLSGGGW